MTALPWLMVAPTGARLSRNDHPALPLTVPQLLASARTCRDAGAGALQLHLRDAGGAHILDAGLYREAVDEFARTLPGFRVQVATDAAGRYDAAAQRRFVFETGHDWAAVSPAEMAVAADPEQARGFYLGCAERGIHIQHVLHAPAEVELLRRILPDDMFHHPRMQLLLVLGSEERPATGPAQLTPFLLRLAAQGISPDWMVAAHGRSELACLRAAHASGGRLRTGLATGRYLADGSQARDNAARVAEVAWHTIRKPDRDVRVLI